MNSEKLRAVVAEHYSGQAASVVVNAINDPVIPVLGVVTRSQLNKLDASLDIVPALQADASSIARAAVNGFQHGDGLDLGDPEVEALLDALSSISATVKDEIKAAGTTMKSRAQIEGLGRVRLQHLSNIGVV